jgi:amino-acid N-acetyltransferase
MMRAVNLIGVTVAQVRALLAACELPTEDLDDGRVQLIGAFDDGELVGCVGLERYGSQALVRSLAVAAAFQARGIGTTLLRSAIDRARSGGVAALWGVTTTADAFLQRFGFAAVGRDLVDRGIAMSSQLRSVCPDDAIVLRLNLEAAREGMNEIMDHHGAGQER